MSASPPLLFPPILAIGSAIAPGRDAPLDLSLDADSFGPAVTIQKHSNHTTEEYRVDGYLDMIKVNPKGPSY